MAGNRASLQESQEESEASEEERCLWESPAEERCSWESPVEERCSWESPVVNRGPWGSPVVDRGPWGSPVVDRGPWGSPVRGWLNSASEEDEDEDEEGSEDGEEEYDSEDSSNLKENQGTEQRENQAAIPSVEEVVASLGSKLQEFVTAATGLVLEMDSTRAREAGEIDAVVKGVNGVQSEGNHLRKRKMPGSTGARGIQEKLVTCKDSLTAQLRKGFVTSVQQHHSALTAAATPESVDLSMKDLTDMQAEIKSACESLQGGVLALISRKANVLEEENLKLKGEVQRWKRLHSQVTARMTQFEAAAAADKLRFQDEKCQLVLKALVTLDVEKAKVAAETLKEAHVCQICLDRPRNSLVLPCLHGQFCEECVEKYRKTGKTCPACRGVIRGTIGPYIA